MVQGELFREESTVSGLSGSGLSRKQSFFSRFQFTVSLDKLLVGLIGLTVVFVLTYSFGVEHGKRLMEKQIATMFPAVSRDIISTAAKTPAQDNFTQPVQKETILLVDKAVGSTSKMETTQDITPPSVEATPSTSLSAVEKTKLSLPKVDQSKGKYTIQLVTYNNEQLAGKEIEHLKTKGHEGFIIPSGSYLQVCVNYFGTRTRASSFLKQFPESSRYPGAYIRPVVR